MGIVDLFSSVQSLSHVWLFDSTDCSLPGLPVHHQLLELAQTHVHWVGDTIQQSHPLSSPSPPAFNLSQHQDLSNESVLCTRWLKYWSFSFNISPSTTDFISDGLVGSPSSPRDSQESSPTSQFKSINFLVLSLLYSPTLTSIHDYWKNQSFD